MPSESQAPVFDHPQLLPQLVALRAAQTPDRVYLEEVGGRSMTYGEAHALSQRWAQALADLGVARGQTVSGIMSTDIDHVVVQLALAWIGAYEAPVNPDFRGNMLEHVVNDSLARVVIVADDLIGHFRDVARFEHVETVVVLGDRAVAAGLPYTVLAAEDIVPATCTRSFNEPRPRDVAAILYTSGTTGRSKGVMFTWAQGWETARTSMHADLLTEQDVIFCPLPFFHMGGRNFIFLAAIIGSKCVLRNGFSTSAFWDDVRRHGVTTTVLMGGMARFLVNQPAEEGLDDTTLRNVLMSPMIAEVDAFEARYGVRVCTSFNMTEISNPITTDGYTHSNPLSCGQLREGYSARLVDEDDREVGPGELGELILRADDPWLLMAGYWQRPEATVEAWRNLWFHTGDVFTKDAQGNFFFVDRLKDAMRRRGENVSSLEVELELNAHPDVAESAAVGVESATGEQEIKAIVVLHPGATLGHEELIEFLAPRMPRYMVPRYVEFVDAMPKTPTHKIRKVELRAAGITPGTWDRDAAGVALPR